MHISQISINRPVTTAMFFLAVILVGIISLSQLSVDLLPDLSYPRITIWTTVSDMGPREVEEMLTTPIEEAIGTVANIRRTHSVSRSGLSLVTVEFLWGTDMDFATLGIREKLDQLRWILPRQVERPNILRIDPRSQPIMALSLSGSNLVHLKDLANNVFKRRLEQIKGVAMVTVTGGLEREIQVEIDQQRVQALNLSPSNIARSLPITASLAARSKKDCIATRCGHWASSRLFPRSSGWSSKIGKMGPRSGSGTSAGSSMALKSGRASPDSTMRRASA